MPWYVVTFRVSASDQREAVKKTFLGYAHLEEVYPAMEQDSPPMRCPKCSSDRIGVITKFGEMSCDGCGYVFMAREAKVGIEPSPAAHSRAR